MPKTVVITGDKRVDKIIRRIGDPKTTNKIVVQAMRRALKPLASAAKANSPVDSGAFKRAVKVRAGKRSRKGPTMLVAVLNSDLQKAKGGDGKGNRAYAAAVEYGDEDQEGSAPFRRAFDAGAATSRDAVLADIKAGLMAAAKS